MSKILYISDCGCYLLGNTYFYRESLKYYCNYINKKWVIRKYNQLLFFIDKINNLKE